LRGLVDCLLLTLSQLGFDICISITWLSWIGSFSRHGAKLSA
jgi:hypothetical protein